VADGQPAPAMSARQAIAVAGVSFAVAPLLAFLLHVPVVAVGLVGLQMVIAIPLAAKQGAALARRHFLRLGLNLVLEGAARFLLGAVAGWFLGEIGLATGLCVGTLVALVALPNRGAQGIRENRPRTSLVDTSLTLALLGLYVQFDILVSPSILHTKSSLYDLAAVPSKGVYVVLLAAGPLVFPFIRRRQDGNRLIVLSALVVLGAGLVCAAVIATALPLIGVVLGQPKAHLNEFIVLGAAMAVAGVTGVVTTASVARGVKRPWPPPLIGMAVLLLSWPFRPTPLTFAIVVAASQALTCVLCVVNCLWGRRGEPETPASGDRSDPSDPSDLRQVESLAEAGDLLATAQGGQQLEQQREQRLEQLERLEQRLEQQREQRLERLEQADPY
jgi:hypothetical protein